jgi:hypothetical protein
MILYFRVSKETVGSGDEQKRERVPAGDLEYLPEHVMMPCVETAL